MSSIERESKQYHRWKNGEGYKMNVWERRQAYIFADCIDDTQTMSELNEEIEEEAA